jgi:IMP dehydrogenase
MEQILYGPSTRADGSLNFIGALKRTMASTGYSEVKDLQRVEVVVSPYQPS